MRSELYKVNDLIEDYACYFIDWERLYYEQGYKPEFPQKLLDIQKSVNVMISELKDELPEHNSPYHVKPYHPPIPDEDQF